MREKLLNLMKNEGLKPSQLAEMLEINPAGVSHILAGRNKPGFDLLQKILRRFPQINPDWLLLDSEKMYREENGTAAGGSVGAQVAQFPERNMGVDRPTGGLFNQTSSQQILLAAQQALHTGEHAGIPNTNTSPNTQTTVEVRGDKIATASAVARVVIFYEDQTFESFTPRPETM